MKVAMNWATEDASEAVKRECVHMALASLERTSPETFLDTLHDCGYSTQPSKKISAAFWTAMSKDADLQVQQQRIINKYLACHFDCWVCVFEAELAHFSSNYMEYYTEYLDYVDSKTQKKRKVQYSWKDLSTVVKFYSSMLFMPPFDDIEKIEISLGGNHGKGKFSFVAIIIIGYRKNKNANKEDKVVELQIGQIDDSSDKLELLRPLLSRLETSVRRMNLLQNGCCRLWLENANNNIYFSAAGAPTDPKLSVILPVELFLVGDLKFLLMVVGRDGYSGLWCLYCHLKQAEWVRVHVQKNLIHCEATKWTIPLLMAQALVAQQPDTQVQLAPTNNTNANLITPATTVANTITTCLNFVIDDSIYC
ncbi:hypothetical protein ACA910_010147 [Epithemia clementina (nom. ined.)]